MADRADPFARFRDLYRRAEALDIDNVNAMTVGAVAENGQPSVRAVLLKDFDEQGFVFYTNYESRKGGRSWPIRWSVCTSTGASSASRCRSKVAPTRSPTKRPTPTSPPGRAPASSEPGASKQSQPLENRAVLLARVARFEARFLGRKVERPPHWSGFRVVPSRFEFWVEGAFRLHDREIFVLGDEGWSSQRVYP